MQLFTLWHDTRASAPTAAPAGLGTATIDQLLPFHRSTKAPMLPAADARVPTAVQLTGEGHEIPLSEMVTPFGLGVGTIDQLLPFQRSVVDVPAAVWPTAKQVVTPQHDTAVSVPPARFGFGAIDQRLPSQCSAKGFVITSAPTPVEY